MNYQRNSLVESALSAMEAQINYTKPIDPDWAKDYARLNLATLPYECFGVFFLDSQHRFISHEVMFRGTLTQTSVYPREIARASLLINAAAVIIYHNHPSGSLEPSMADRALTKTLRDALKLIDVNVLDHLVVSVEGVTSFAERGLMYG